MKSAVNTNTKMSITKRKVMKRKTMQKKLKHDISELLESYKGVIPDRELNRRKRVLNTKLRGLGGGAKTNKQWQTQQKRMQERKAKMQQKKAEEKAIKPDPEAMDEE